jgi:DNA-binding response OmpR family regulator
MCMILAAVNSPLYSTPPPRLMVVDDEEDVCTVMKWSLQQAGFDVDAFSQPVTALEHFRPYRYDLVLIDVKMPDMDGFEFYCRIKDIQHDVKACFMTAALDSNEEFITKHLPGNNKRVCVARKPIRIQELVLLLSAEMDSAYIDRVGEADAQ